MKLPASLANFKEWTLIGPMGPEVPTHLSSHPLLCVDGGAHFCNKMDVWIGDGDSYKEIVNCANIYRLPQDKSVSDFALALSFFDSGSMVLHCWGFLGGRMDHEILNLGAALSYLDNGFGPEVNFYKKNGKLAVKCVAAGEWPMSYQGTFSLVCVKNTKIKILGSCQYTLEQETELSPLSSLGLSNVAQGQFTLINQGPLLIIFPESD
jgi:thiamine pyrophosphokinase